MRAGIVSGYTPGRLRQAVEKGLPVVKGVLLTIATTTSAGLRAEEPAAVSSLEDGGFLELGIETTLGSTNREQLDDEDNDNDEDNVNIVFEISPFFSGAWRKGRWFIEGVQGSVDGASIGATLWYDDRWVVDLLGVNLAGEISVEFDSPSPPEGTSRADKRLLERDTLFVASGIRIRRYVDSSLIQVSAVVDWENGNGLLLAAHVGRQWQLGNWNTQFVVGARHASANLADYVWGIDDNEATTRFPSYEVPDITFAEMQLSASRALGTDWVLNTRLRGRRFESGLVDSPLVSGPGFVVAETSIAYVF